MFCQNSIWLRSTGDFLEKYLDSDRTDFRRLSRRLSHYQLLMLVKRYYYHSLMNLY